MIDNWSALAPIVVERWGTPIYAFQSREIESAYRQLDSIPSPVSVRHWLSCKTLALPPLLQQWKDLGQGIEVISSFELQAALAEGFAAEQILVNGPAKQRWLREVNLSHLNVQFDSNEEARALASVARQREWKIGLRLHTSGNRDPDDERYSDQFGITFMEIQEALDILQTNNLPVNCISFHLHSNLRTIDPYLSALDEIAWVAYKHGLKPKYVDIGGGLPAPGETASGIDGIAFDLNTMSDVYERSKELFPGLQELWLENGRFISSRAGVLLVRVWDIKYRGDMRYLLCDGGRVNHALPSDWETHGLTVVPSRGGDEVQTTVCGPTCMAYDTLIRTKLPSDIKIGDILVWHNAGAYHLAWETRFSSGTAPIVWFDRDDVPQLVRPRESFESWWGI